jgi:acetylornithine aminotransferase/acetylornithine/N-succinyldiaminopimelate aminotransferase
MGLMLAVDLDSSETAKAVVSELLAKGILINRTHETVLRFLPPYIIEKRHVDEVVRALDLALAKSGTKSRTTKHTKVNDGKRKQSERSH